MKNIYLTTLSSKNLVFLIVLWFLNPMWCLLAIVSLIMLMFLNTNKKWRKSMVKTAKLIREIGGAPAEG